MQARKAAFALAAGAFALLAWQMARLSSQHLLFGDFHAFYCGGRLAARGINPYLAAPLAHCEAIAHPFGLHRAPAGLSEPVPFPGYAFLLFMPFGVLPYLPACVLWFAMIAGCGAAGALLLGRILRLPFAAVFAVFACGFAVAVWPYGELSSIVLCALAASAWALQRSRFAFAAASLCVALVLPHLAAPSFIALLLWERRARLPLLIGAAALAIADLAIGGPGVALSYFTSVLPAHAQSEIGYVTQYGLTWFLHALGAADRTALAAGDLSYAAAAICGIMLARGAARATGERSMLVLLPAAFAAIAGPFIHYSEIMLALPAALLLAVRGRGIARIAACGALCAIAVPWEWLTQVPLVVPAVLALLCIARWTLGMTARNALRVAAAGVMLAAIVVVAAATLGPQLSHGGAVQMDASLAQASWAEYLRAHGASSGAFWWIAKAPTWIGLLLLALSGAYAVANEELVRPAAVEQVPAAP